jgi:hypothetical protein
MIQKVEWNPKLYIENAINEPKEIYKYFLENDGESTIVTQRRHIKGLSIQFSKIL